jgi:hypothetical protein
MTGAFVLVLLPALAAMSAVTIAAASKPGDAVLNVFALWFCLLRACVTGAALLVDLCAPPASNFFRGHRLVLAACLVAFAADVYGAVWLRRQGHDEDGTQAKRQWIAALTLQCAAAAVLLVAVALSTTVVGRSAAAARQAIARLKALRSKN